ncbi:hypothetical protein HDU85_005925 [Gaertneriomyces sp. JEL0708]|nr:hypothetical protein HDU85_005925 [Gaertneriomyces sp. JEL0708]
MRLLALAALLPLVKGHVFINVLDFLPSSIKGYKIGDANIENPINDFADRYKCRGFSDDEYFKVEPAELVAGDKFERDVICSESEDKLTCFRNDYKAYHYDPNGSGCALSIRRRGSDDEFKIFSIDDQCPGEPGGHHDGKASFEVPKWLPECDECMCSWSWLPGTKGAAHEMYQTCFPCKVVNPDVKDMSILSRLDNLDYLCTNYEGAGNCPKEDVDRYKLYKDYEKPSARINGGGGNSDDGGSGGGGDDDKGDDDEDTPSPSSRPTTTAKGGEATTTPTGAAYPAPPETTGKDQVGKCIARSSEDSESQIKPPQASPPVVKPEDKNTPQPIDNGSSDESPPAQPPASAPGNAPPSQPPASTDVPSTSGDVVAGEPPSPSSTHVIVDTTSGKNENKPDSSKPKEAPSNSVYPQRSSGLPSTVTASVDTSIYPVYTSVTKTDDNTPSASKVTSVPIDPTKAPATSGVTSVGPVMVTSTRNAENTPAYQVPDKKVSTSVLHSTMTVQPTAQQSVVSSVYHAPSPKHTSSAIHSNSVSSSMAADPATTTGRATRDGGTKATSTAVYQEPSGTPGASHSQIRAATTNAPNDHKTTSSPIASTVTKEYEHPSGTTKAYDAPKQTGTGVPSHTNTQSGSAVQSTVAQTSNVKPDNGVYPTTTQATTSTQPTTPSGYEPPPNISVSPVSTHTGYDLPKPSTYVNEYPPSTIASPAYSATHSVSESPAYDANPSPSVSETPASSPSENPAPSSVDYDVPSYDEPEEPEYKERPCTSNKGCLISRDTKRKYRRFVKLL